MNERIRFGRQKYFVKLNVSDLTAKSNLESQQGRIKEENIGGICPVALLQKKKKRIVET